MKRLTHKQLKESGWESFLEWAIANKYSPDDLIRLDVQREMRTRVATKMLAKAIETTMFTKSEKLPDMIGLSEQVKPRVRFCFECGRKLRGNHHVEAALKEDRNQFPKTLHKQCFKDNQDIYREIK